MNSVAFYTLGCKLNFSETSSISRQFMSAGYDIKPFEEAADLYVINTCSVTDHADRKCKKVVRAAKKLNPNARVAIIGCYAQLKPKEIAEIPGVDMVLGAAEKFNMLEHLTKLDDGNTQIANGHIKEVKEFIPSYSIGDRTRTFLKVQDGCNYFCSFCTIPLARGRSRSPEIAEIVEQATRISEEGTREIVLTGVNTGDFGSCTSENFFQLAQALDEVNGIDRFRISSIEPNLLTDEIIEFVANSRKFVPHFHIPLQSGNDEILRKMRRRYERKRYRTRVEKIKSLMPDACIGVDVLVGFPGEGEEQFLDSYRFLNELDIQYLHVFSYSERPNTTAVRMEGGVSNAVRTDRRKMLQILSEKKKRHFYEKQIGQFRQVLFEGKHKNGFLYGHTDNYLHVKVPYDPMLINELESVELLEIGEDGAMVGDLITVKKA